MRPIDPRRPQTDHRGRPVRQTDPGGWKPYDAAPRTALPDLAELYDRRRPELDWRDPNKPDQSPTIPLPARPLDEDLRNLGRPADRVDSRKRERIGEPTILDRGQQALRQRLAQPGHAIGIAIAIAFPYLLTAAVAFALGYVGPLTGSSRIPLATVVVLAFVAVMMVMSYAIELPSLGRIWLVYLVTLGSLMPLLALQSTFSAIPYVSADRSSAEPVIMTALVTAVVLGGIAVLCASLHYETPGDAAVLFLPAALIVPIVLMGPASDIPNRGLATIVSVSIVAAIASSGAQLIPEGFRQAVAAIAAGAVLVALTTAGRLPRLPDSSSSIVAWLLWGLVGLALVLTVVVPVLARWLRHVEGEARLVPEPDARA